MRQNFGIGGDGLILLKILMPILKWFTITLMGTKVRCAVMEEGV
jgi:hypothetical protein